MTTNHLLMETQFQMEAEMVSHGVEAFRKDVATKKADGDVASTPGGVSIMMATIQPVADALAEWIEERRVAGSGSRHRAYLCIRDMDPVEVAFISLKVAINTVGFRGQPPSLQAVTKRIGRAMEYEARFSTFARSNRKLYKLALLDLDKRTQNERHRRRVLTHTMTKNNIEFNAWTDIERFHVGALLFDVAQKVTGMFDVRLSGSHGYTYRVDLKPETLKLMEKRDDWRSLMMPRVLPTVVPPRDWDTEGMNGGYYTNILGGKPVPMVRSNSIAGGGVAGAHLMGDLTECSWATNAVQHTAWRINERTFEVYKWLLSDAPADLRVLPTSEDLEIPPKPHDIDHNEEAKRKWKKKAALTHNENVSSRSRRIAALRTMTVAEEMCQFERFYFPHNLDFRGRMYALPQWLTPQGPDYAKALLEFADGEPITDANGSGWLAIHGANIWGEDKGSLADRIYWVHAHEERIKAVAGDPIANLWWTEADKPMGFLAFCFEWAAFLDHGFGFVSRLPVSMDGSCNGIQHFSAMLRDPVGGAAVNLIPSDKPSDIYQMVADRVKEKLECTQSTETASGYEPTALRPSSSTSAPGSASSTASAGGLGTGHIARKWLASSLITRKVTKRPVMVLPYGGKWHSCRSYVAAAIREAWTSGEANPFHEDEVEEALLLLAKLVWESIGEVVVSAREVMDWLQSVSRLAGNSGVRDIAWKTPTGFNACQSYVSTRARRVKSALNGSTIYVTFKQPTDKLDKRRQAQAVAPNFVHSMDAAAMVKTINLAKRHGVTRFAMVHDSYGTSAQSAAMLAACCRQSFVDMYRAHDVLQQFLDGVALSLPEGAMAKLKPPPEKGNLDLEQIKHSDFFFA